MKIHFMGIGGSGIFGVAKLAESMGHFVTGCDLEDSTAYGTGILKGHSPSHLKNVDLVVVSPAVIFQNSQNPEYTQAKEKGILLTWQEFLGKILLKDKKLICIAGTHGKSTTTAMAGKLLIDAGLDPVVVLGANVPEWGGSARSGAGEYAVIEADEFNNNFLNFKPEIAIINNIEFDHPDFFKNEAEVRESFKKFIGNLVGEKILITQADDPHIKFNLKVLGEHNQKNAGLVYVLGKKLGIPEGEIVKSLEGFTGIGRRMELISVRSGVRVFDDYAHHPTAIEATLKGLRARYPKAKILLVHEPHGYKRTKALLEQYKGVFDDADRVIIGPIFQARDEIDPSITPELVAKVSGHKNAIGLNSLNKIIEKWKGEKERFDIVVVMGAGKSYLWAREIAGVLPVSFSDLTTFRIGGAIHKYIELKNKEALLKLPEQLKEKNSEIFIIGGGSDILVSDKKFEGIVIKYTGKNLDVRKSESPKVLVRAEAGMVWDDLVGYAVENNLQGIECLSGIPGSVGAAPIQNIGAYGQELKNTFVNLTAFDIKNEKFIEFSAEDCKFGYRESIFKNRDFWQKYIITDITLELIENGQPEVKYESLKNYLDEKGMGSPTLKSIRESVLSIRRGKFEDPKEAGNAGSFFKNPILSELETKRLLKKYPDMPARVQEDGNYKGSAGWFIEKAGFKGKKFNGAAVSPRHALILLNPEGKAKAEDILLLSEKIIKEVDEKFDIKLEREVQLINF